MTTLSNLLKSQYTLQDVKQRSQFWKSLFEDIEDQMWFVNTRENTENNNEQIILLQLPAHATGYTGIAHGGLLATLLDEALCYAAYPVLPHKIGVTASLNVSYLQPTPSTSWIIIRAIATSKEGSRKADVQGSVYIVDPTKEELPWINNKPTVTATQVVVEPKWSEKLH